MDSPSRRAFLQATLPVLAWAALTRQALAADAVAGTLKFATRPWIARLEEACAAAAARTLAPEGWRRDIAAVFGAVDPADLLRAIDFDRLARSARFPAMEEGLQRVLLLEDDGRAAPLHFSAWLFALAPGVSVVPHGHHNMLSAHLLLQGAARVRHFDRVADEPGHVVIRPSSDEQPAAGALASISEDRDNIHWFQAERQPVFMFNVQVGRLDANRPSGGRDYVDPLRAARLEGGRLRAPRLDRDTAYARYAKASA